MTVCAVSGMCRVGKWQLAAAHPRRCEEQGWPFIAWINAANRESIIEHLSSLAVPCRGRR